MIRGILKFKDENFVFDLDETKFLLEIEKVESRQFDKEYFRNLNKMQPSSNLFSGMLVGEIFKSGKLVYFNMKDIKQKSHNQFLGRVNSYLLSEKLIHNDTDLVYDALEIQADELNYFYPVSEAFSFNEKLDTVFINNHEVTSEKFSFDFKENNIEAELDIDKSIHFMTSNPLSASSSLNLRFSEKKELSFAEGLTLLIRKFLMFVTFRRNINCTKILLKRKIEADKPKLMLVGSFFMKSNDSFVEETHKAAQQQIIDYQLIKDHLSNLFMNLDRNKVYMNHLPKTIQASRLITPERYIMVTAGFEWEFGSSLEDKLTNDIETKYSNEIKEISEFFERKMNDTEGKQRRFYKNMKRRALGYAGQAHTLEQRLKFAFKEFDEVLSVFIKHIFSLNGVKFDSDYEELAKRIAERRNAIGHGNIAKEAHRWHGIDMLILEWLYYTMLLKSIGMTDDTIKVSINQLFKRGIAL